MNEDTFRRLSEADWGTLSKELFVFVLHWLNGYYWQTGSKFLLPKGMTPQDIVQEVISKTISGERRWDPAKGELAPWLKDQAKSMIDALAKSAPHKREMPAIARDGDDEEEFAINQSHETDTPETELIEKEAALSTERLIGQLFEATHGDSDLNELLEAILDGCEPKPRFLAAALNTSTNDINNRLKRLRRLAEGMGESQ